MDAKLKIILQFVGLQRLTEEQYRMLSETLLTHAEYMKQMAPVGNIIEELAKAYFDKKGFRLGDKLDFKESEL